jgi:hypothetical protein
MRNRWHVIIVTLLIMLGIAGALICVSADMARRASERLLGGENGSLPYYSTRLTFDPERLLSSVDPPPHRIGWVVSYANKTGYDSAAFFVTLSGKVLTMGLPKGIPAVDKYLERRSNRLEKFTRAIQDANTTIKLGTSYSAVVEILGNPTWVDTNNGVVRADFFFDPKVVGYTYITNGFTVFFSNDVVFRKLPITSSSP